MNDACSSGTARAPVVASVVMSTYNRGAMLGDAIRSLLALAPGTPSHEIIVVDNNSTDDTRACVEQLIPGSGGRLRYVFEGRQGVAYGRNTGVAASTGAIVAFTDDDVRVEPRWLATVVRAFDEHPSISYAGGRVLPRWPARPPAWYSHEAHSAPLALVDYGDDARPISRTSFLCLVSANLAVRRDVFERYGGFDPRHQHQPGAVAACEDHELQARMLRDGHVGRYVPDATMYADVQPERMRKAYHRRWHFDHGRAIVRMTPPGHIFDGRCDFVPIRAGARWLGNVPLYLARETLSSLRAALSHAVRGDRERAFWWECQSLEHAGAIAYHAQGRSRSEGGQGPDGTHGGSPRDCGATAARPSRGRTTRSHA